MAAGATVRLHIYDISKNPTVGKANRLLRGLGTGIFHSSVEVYGNEWGYGGGFVPQATGVYRSKPGADLQHEHREALDLGPTALSREEVDVLLRRLEREWLALEYNLVRHNCSHFTVAFCEELGVGPVPAWITSLASVGEHAESLIEVAVDLGQGLHQQLQSWDRFLSIQRPELGPGCRERAVGNLRDFAANYLLAAGVFLALVLLGRPLRLLLALVAAAGYLMARRRFPGDAALCNMLGVAAAFAMAGEALLFCALLAILHALAHPGNPEAKKQSLQEKVT